MLNFDFRQLKRLCIQNWNAGRCGSEFCECQKECYALFKEDIMPKDFDIQLSENPTKYSWEVVEDDGYTYFESGTAYDIIDATWKAIEYNTDQVKSIRIVKEDN